MTEVLVSPVPRPARRWARLRADPATAVLRGLLLVGWLAVGITVLVSGQRAAPLDELRAAVADGELSEVRISEGLPPGTTGTAVQVAVWRTGLVTHRTEVWQISLGQQAPDGTRPVLTDSLADELRAADPSLDVGRLGEPATSSELYGWRMPGWVGLVVLPIGLGVLFLLLGGPVPERATRWAWFWLVWSPLGSLAFLVLSGPFPGVPAPRPGARRLTGGWALLLSLVLGTGFFAGAG